jgi:hypothetical protein
MLNQHQRLMRRVGVIRFVYHDLQIGLQYKNCIVLANP